MCINVTLIPLFPCLSFFQYIFDIFILLVGQNTCILVSDVIHQCMMVNPGYSTHLRLIHPHHYHACPDTIHVFSTFWMHRITRCEQAGLNYIPFP